MVQVIHHLRLFNGMEQVWIDIFKNFVLKENIHLGDNHARILYYELQYNTSFQPNNWISVPIEQRKEIFNEVKSADGSIKLEAKITSNEMSNVCQREKWFRSILAFKTTHLPPNQNDLRVSLSCSANYTFRVIAYNQIGASDPSPISKSMCSTSTCRPETNPSSVKASMTQSKPLVIEWDVRTCLILIFPSNELIHSNDRACLKSNGVHRNFGTKWVGDNIQWITHRTYLLSNVSIHHNDNLLYQV